MGRLTSGSLTRQIVIIKQLIIFLWILNCCDCDSLKISHLIQTGHMGNLTKPGSANTVLYKALHCGFRQHMIRADRPVTPTVCLWLSPGYQGGSVKI